MAALWRPVFSNAIKLPHLERPKALEMVARFTNATAHKHNTHTISDHYIDVAKSAAIMHVIITISHLIQLDTIGINLGTRVQCSTLSHSLQIHDRCSGRLRWLYVIGLTESDGESDGFIRTVRPHDMRQETHYGVLYSRTHDKIYIII